MDANERFQLRPALSWRHSLVLSCLLLPALVPAGSPEPGAVQQQVSPADPATAQEEEENYFRKWLDEDVLYIISDEEREVFQKLTTPEEKEQFIEQFWQRRDPDLKTSGNEFKDEHYRRLAYANERFSVGQPGWMSDRGRIYILHGPPAQIESHPTGGQYQRPSWEGGGWTQVYPFEVWRYNYIEGVGSDILLEFVDRSMSGQYRLVMNPEEKDALLEMGKSGATLAEIFRQSSKADRPYLNPLNRDQGLQRLRDNPFERYMTFAKVQAATPIRYKDLQEIVKVDISYADLPFQVRIDYFRLNETQSLIPVTLQLEDRNLTFEDANGAFVAEAAVYGLVTSITHRVVQEFEDELVTSYERLGDELTADGRSLYQKILVLDDTMRYRLDVVVKDLKSGRVGVVRKAIVPPRFDARGMSMSSLILSNYIEVLEEPPQENTMFVLGDLKVRPASEDSFSSDRPLLAYFQVYNAALDQGTLTPALSISYTISRDGKTVVELFDESLQSIQFFSAERVVLIQQLPVNYLEPGRYQLEIQVKDRISRLDTTTDTEFQLLASDPGGKTSGTVSEGD